MMMGLWLLAASAFGADLTAGVVVGVSSDLPDIVSAEYARFGPGLMLQVPLFVEIAPAARLRAALRADLAPGSDRVVWTQTIDGEAVRFYDDDHWAMLGSMALTVGGDFTGPADWPVRPYFGVDGGAARVTTWHSLGGNTQILLDPAQNDLSDPRNIDPYTAQFTWLADVHAGASRDVSDRVALWLEAGYSLAFLDARPLRKTPPELDATRSAYGWNAIRVGLGVGFAL